MSASACTASNTQITTTADASGPTKSACSTGPAYPEDTAFPLGKLGDDVDETCTPRCDASKGGANQFPLDAVPSGACTVGGERCGMLVRRYCPNGDLRTVDGMECECTSGNWRCVINSQGGGACPSAEALADAGARD